MKCFRSALVTGATGFIGSAMVDLLERKGVEVTCLVRSRLRLEASRRSLAGLRVIEDPNFQSKNLRLTLANISADVVFNFASYGVRPEDRDSQQLIDGNVGLTVHLLEATAHWPLQRFVHAASCSEYGFPDPEYKPVAESHPLRPTSVYGAAKAASFLFGTALAARLNVPFVALRLFGVFGKREGPWRLIPYLISKLEQDRSVDLTPGDQVRDYLYVEDAAEAFFEAANGDLNCWEAYNVCSGFPTRIRDLGEAVADALGKPRHLLHWGERQYRTDEPMMLLGDNHRFVGETGWHPRINTEQGVNLMIHARR